MPLCCCGIRLKLSKSNRNRKCKKDGINSQFGDKVTTDVGAGIIDCGNNIDYQHPKVIFKTEINEDISVRDSSENMSIKQRSYHNNALLKSVLHRSTRFDSNENGVIESSDVNRHSHKPEKQFDVASRRGSLFIFRNADDIIITPFAQILASLRKVRANFILITNAGSNNDDDKKRDQHDTVIITTKRPPPDVITKSSDSTKTIATETLNELEWCLDRLENIQTHRSVSDMASTKFKQIINRELSQYAETSKSGHQISDYICKTFLDSQQDDNLSEATSAERDIEQYDDVRRNELSKYGPKLTKAYTEPILHKRKQMNESLEVEEISTEIGDDINGDQLTGDGLPILGVTVPDEELVIEIINQNLLKWGMDLFSFTKFTTGKSLVVISYAIFKHHNLINKFQIDNKILVQFLIKVENSYRSTVPYHNSIHAADVTQSANVLLNGPALDNVFSDLEILSVIFACIVHDMDHPGVTNQYLVNTNSELATLYNDSSVLENHHLAMAFTLLTNKDCDFLTALSKRQKQSMRRMVIDMVLATDMSKHMTLLADLKTMVETKKVAGSGILTLDTYTDRIQILQNLVHCSDLSNPTKPLTLYKTWTDRIMEEFFLQGDKERENELEISPMCDRQTATVEKSQVSFIDFIVHPLWETWSELVYPDSQGILDTLEENRQWYFNMSQEKAIVPNDSV